MAAPAPRGPELSVVVATRNRAALLPRLVQALEAQKGAPAFELVLVDDGSTDDTAATIERLARGSSLCIRAERLGRSGGPAAARNAGWRAAHSPLIGFTDDDCVPQPGWLAGLARGLRGADIAQGTTLPNPGQPMRGMFSRAPTATYERGFYETCNVGYRVTTLDAVGGFDERFGPRRGAPIWGEDTDLAWRAKEAGATTTFVTDAVVWHDMKPGRLRDELADLPRRAGNVRLVKRHPGVRVGFESRWFVQSAHAPMLATLAALVAALLRPSAARRWLLVTGCAVAWARHRAVYHPRRDWPLALPQWFVVDAADVAVMAAASARERTVLL